MLSLKKKRAPVGEDLSNTLLLVIETLLRALEVHSVRGDPADHERFQADIGGLREAFGGRSAQAMLTAADSAKKMVEEYNQRAAHFLRMQALERQKVADKLTDTLAAVTGCPERSILQLRDLEHRIAKARSIEEVKKYGAQLSECLEGLREDNSRRMQRMEQVLSALRRKVQSLPWEGPGDDVPHDLDASVELPSRPKAEAALEKVMLAGGYGFVVAYVVDRVQLINARFGYAVGDEILAMFQEHLKQGLKKGDQLFRWTGPAFLVLMDRTSLAGGVRAEVNHLTSAKLETTVHLERRSVLLPVTARSAIFSLFEATSTAELIQEVDAFVARDVRG